MMQYIHVQVGKTTKELITETMNNRTQVITNPPKIVTVNKSGVSRQDC
jgi:hypothetical protein